MQDFCVYHLVCAHTFHAGLITLIRFHSVPPLTDCLERSSELLGQFDHDAQKRCLAKKSDLLTQQSFAQTQTKSTLVLAQTSNLVRSKSQNCCGNKHISYLVYCSLLTDSDHRYTLTYLLTLYSHLQTKNIQENKDT